MGLNIRLLRWKPAGCRVHPARFGWRLAASNSEGLCTADLPWLNAVESASGHSCSYTDSRIGPIVGGDIIRPTADGWRDALCTLSGDLTNCFSVQAPTEGSRGVAARTAMTVAVQVKRRRRTRARVSFPQECPDRACPTSVTVPAQTCPVNPASGPPGSGWKDGACIGEFALQSGTRDGARTPGWISRKRMLAAQLACILAAVSVGGRCEMIGYRCSRQQLHASACMGVRTTAAVNRPGIWKWDSQWNSRCTCNLKSIWLLHMKQSMLCVLQLSYYNNAAYRLSQCH